MSYIRFIISEHTPITRDLVVLGVTFGGKLKIINEYCDANGFVLFLLVPTDGITILDVGY